MRVKTGTVRKNKHRKILKLAKGYWMTRHKLFKSANEAVLHAGQYSYIGRKRRKREMRRLWIVRINGALKNFGISYNKFVNNLKKAKIEIDRKILSVLAKEDPKTFKKIVEKTSKIPS